MATPTLKCYQRRGHLQKMFPDTPLFVLQAAANDSDGLDFEQVVALFTEKYAPRVEELEAKRNQQVKELMGLLPSLDEEDAQRVETAAAEPKPKPKKNRLQGGAGGVKKKKKVEAPAEGTAPPPQPHHPRPGGIFRMAEEPKCVELRPGVVLIKKALDTRLQQQFCRVSCALGQPIEPGQSSGWYKFDRKTGEQTLNEQSTFSGQMLEHLSRFPPQYSELCKHFMRQAQSASPVIPDIKHSICLVNYYAPNGFIEWHRDNSARERESAAKGNPVVSVSLGQSADFAYRMEKDDPVQYVCLNSGDVLVFGGPSRLILHAITKIYPNTMPSHLSEVMPPGRLNLTFRHEDGAWKA